MCTHYSNIYLLKKKKMSKRDYIEYIDSWMSRKENCGRSFTYWNAMYDWIKESRFDFDDLWIRDEINEVIQAQSWADMDWVKDLSDDAVAEILDISDMDEYGRQIQEEINEEDKQEIFDKLDEYTSFETREQYEETVANLVDEIGNPELNWNEIAQEYEDSNYLHIDEEENVQED